jgi:FKBP-type peptidyl-prolyl cis-trans isomerase FklB
MKTIKFIVVTIITVTLMSCNGQGVTNKPLKTELDSVSYAVGMDMAIKLKSNFDEVERDFFVQGYQNGMDSINLQLEEKDVSKVLNDYFRRRQQEKAKVKAAEATKKAEEEFGDVKIEGEKFMAENKLKKGVITTDSGLQYFVMKQGNGSKPKRSDRVVVHYHGTLTDGTVFDSSVDKGKPYETGVGQVVQGWIEGLQLMNVGSKYKFFVPQELGYGANPRPGGVIKPFAPMIFELELLEIK